MPQRRAQQTSIDIGWITDDHIESILREAIKTIGLNHFESIINLMEAHIVPCDLAGARL